VTDTQPRAGSSRHAPGPHHRQQHRAAPSIQREEPAGQHRGADDDERGEGARSADGRSDATSPAPTRDAVTAERPEEPSADVPDSRPPLPRRRRQENLAPQLAADTVTAPASVSTVQPEQARQTMAAVLRGTRQARQTIPQAER
jgi:hypothetical protein